MKTKAYRSGNPRKRKNINLQKRKTVYTPSLFAILKIIIGKLIDTTIRFAYACFSKMKHI